MNAFQYYVIDSYIKHPDNTHSHAHVLIDDGLGEDGPLVYDDEYESDGEFH